MMGQIILAGSANHFHAFHRKRERDNEGGGVEREGGG